MTKGRPDQKGATGDAERGGDPTLEIAPRRAEAGDDDDGSGEREFEAPTQLVDAGAYAATVERAAHSEERPPVVEGNDDATRLSPPSALPAPDDAPAASGGGLLPELPHVQLPQQLGQYTLLELLGLGGMAEVFLAQQDGPSGFRRRLVIKRIHPHLSVDDRFVKMFLREARVAAGLQHRNIVRIDELGVDKGVYFIAMELIDGLTLQRLARRAWRAGMSLPMELVLSAAADAASALHYAHSFVDADGTARRIVHRDVSPDNLIVDRAGTTKLLDFGVAKAAGSISVTRAGEVKGKVPYMAPEQLHGRPLDGRADLYSLGATLYWLLTGKRPFRGETDLEVMQAIAYETPIRPRELNPKIPEVVESIILRLLEKRPEDRHANGQLVADELTAILPPSRREVAAFVEQAMALESEDDAEPISASSFVAATPRTAHFVSEARRAWIEGFAPGEGFGHRDDDDQVDDGGPRDETAVTPRAEEPEGTAPEGERREVTERAGPLDAEPLDAEPLDAEPLDAEPLDAEPLDAEPLDAVPLDAGPLELTEADVVPLGETGDEGTPAPALAALPTSGVVEPHAPADPEGSGLRRVPLVAVVAGAGAALLLAFVAWALSDDDDGLPPEVAAIASVQPAGGDARSFHDDDKGAQGSDTDIEAAKATSPNLPSTPAPTDEEDAEAEADTEADPEPDDVEEAKSERTVEAVRTVKVAATGPANVAWRVGKRTLGSGEATLEVPEGTWSVIAYHRGRQVWTRIPIRNGKVDYAEAPKGTLDIRVLPYATIYAGKERLWKVPAPPREVPAGTYKLRIEYEGRSKTETVKVEAGGTAKVRVNMME